MPLINENKWKESADFPTATTHNPFDIHFDEPTLAVETINLCGIPLRIKVNPKFNTGEMLIWGTDGDAKAIFSIGNEE